MYTLPLLDCLYDIQSFLVKEMPEEGTNVREALNRIDQLIDYLEVDK